MPKKMKDPNTGVILEVADYSVEHFASLGYAPVEAAGNEKPKAEVVAVAEKPKAAPRRRTKKLAE